MVNKCQEYKVNVCYQLEPFAPLWFHYEGGEGEDSEESGAALDKWKYSDKYWDQRNTGFQDVKFEPVW